MEPIQSLIRKTGKKINSKILLSVLGLWAGFNIMKSITEEDNNEFMNASILSLP